MSGKGVGDPNGLWAHLIYTAYPRRAEDLTRARRPATLSTVDTAGAHMLRTTEFFTLDDDIPVVLSALVTAVNSGRSPGGAIEDYVQVGFQISGEKVEPISGDPYRYVARLQIDVAKKLHRQLGEMIDSAVAQKS